MGAASSSDADFAIECCVPSRGDGQSLVVVANNSDMFGDCCTPKKGTVLQIQDPVDGVVRVLAQEDDLVRRRELAAFAARPEPTSGPWKGTCSELCIHDGNCICTVGHCGISRITNQEGSPLTRCVGESSRVRGRRGIVCADSAVDLSGGPNTHGKSPLPPVTRWSNSSAKSCGRIVSSR